MDLGWVGMTSVWSEKVRTSRWTSRWTSSMTTGGASGSTSGSLKFSDGVSMSQEWSRVVSAKVKEVYMTLQLTTHISKLKDC